MPAKIMCLILASSILLCGCYSTATLAEGDSHPANKRVIFLLKNGSSISSPAGHHQRTTAGYLVSGKLFGKDDRFLGDFEGAILDSVIQTVSVYEFSGGRTGLVVVVAVALVVVAFAGFALQKTPGWR